MPKMKTHRGAAKRFKVTGEGKVIRGHADHGHNLTKKTRKRKRKLRSATTVKGKLAATIKSMLGA